MAPSEDDLPLFAVRLRACRAQRDYSLAEVAHRLRRLSRETEDGVECGATAKTVWRWEQGEHPTARYRRLLCLLFNATPAELGFRAPLPVEAALEPALDPASVLHMTRLPDSPEMPGPTSTWRPTGFDQLVAALVHRGATPSLADAPIDLSALETAAASAKRSFQACRYALAVHGLAGLLGVLPTLGASLNGDDALRAWAISAHTYHTAAGVLLKLGHEGLAYIAADRSMESAERSQDPLVIGSSARIVAHAFLSTGHFREARLTATSVAIRLDALDRGPQRLSVFGSLLLRGAIAAARDGDRAAALQLLDEADAAAKRLGEDRNYRWTAFGPTNVLLHRVNVSVTLGDAGRALEHARAVDPDRLAVTERRACLYIDAARAFLQWDKYGEACHMLAAAEQLAPEELTSRPSVRTMVGDMVRRAPRSAQPGVRALAARVGSNQ